MILPLGDHRGLAAASARAWAGQTLPADDYEIVAADGGGDPGLTADVRRALREGDRLLPFPGRSEIELYQGGAAAARGRTLLFTESHCLPEPDAAEELVCHLDETGARAACLASGHLKRGGLAPLEAALGDRTITRCPPERWWAVASLRGFAVRRTLFDDVGGFQTRLGRFAETVLALELERRGCRGLVAPGAVVNHGDCTGPRELEEALQALGRGRGRLLGGGVPATLEAALGGLDCVGPADVDPRLARAVCRDAAASIRAGLAGSGRWDLVRPGALAIARLTPIAVAGARGEWLTGRLRARIALWRCATGIGSFERRLEVFRGAWRAAIRCGEIESLDRRPLPALPAPRPPFTFHPGEMGAEHFLGFHGRERDATGSFRWSTPAALARVALPRGTYRLNLRLMLPPGDGHFSLRLNGRSLPLEDVDGPRGDAAASTSLLVVPRTGEQQLVVLATPFEPRREGLDDDRILGIAVRRLTFAPC